MIQKHFSPEKTIILVYLSLRQKIIKNFKKGRFRHFISKSSIIHVLSILLVELSKRMRKKVHPLSIAILKDFPVHHIHSPFFSHSLLNI